MKKYYGFTTMVLSILMLAACNNGSVGDAKNMAAQIQKTVKENSPGFVPTSEAGYYMTARIDGKEWQAKAMLPADRSDSRRVQGENDGESIGFYLWMRGLEHGKKIKFSETNGVDLFTNDDTGIWGGRKGEVEITKMTGNMVEGTFHFTATTRRDAAK